MNCANHPERERASFCQNCGKPLCSECARTVGAGVFCEPCLAARLAAADAASGYTASAPGGTAPNTGILPASGTPNPALAGALGFIPGVAAMYNGQYAKGVVHLIVFTLLASLAADTNGAFGMLVAGWIFYQVFEGYHTARARRDGTPLPNPFGLNDIGERFGFGKAWPGAAPTPVAAIVDAPAAAAYAPPPSSNLPPATSWGAPAYTYTYPHAEGAAPPVPPYAPPVPPFGEGYAAGYVDPQFAAKNRFPTGAIWLIALGLLFFFGSSGVFLHFSIQRLIPFLLIGLGVWVFIRKMTSSGQMISDDGSPAYRLRLFRAFRGAVWLILVGVLFFLDTFNILSWGHSWPLFIIVAGLMTVFERSAYNASANAPFSYPAAGPIQPATPSSAPSTAITPSAPLNPHDEAGS